MARGWFILQVYTGYEAKVSRELVDQRDHKTQSPLQGVLLDVRVPQEDYLAEKGNKKEKKKRNLFPGYILMELDLPEDEVVWRRVYTAIRSINGVAMFLNAGGGQKLPAPLPFDAARAIFEQTGEIHRKVERLDAGFEIGERVRIGEGPFKNFEGEVEEFNVERGVVMVRVEIFGRLTPVELPFAQVFKL